MAESREKTARNGPEIAVGRSCASSSVVLPAFCVLLVCVAAFGGFGFGPVPIDEAGLLRGGAPPCNCTSVNMPPGSCPNTGMDPCPKKKNKCTAMGEPWKLCFESATDGALRCRRDIKCLPDRDDKCKLVDCEGAGAP